MRSSPLIPALLLCACGDEGAGVMDRSLIHTVRRGNLEISVQEQGELQAARDTQVASTLEGRSTLIYLIDEGTYVQAGEKVAELDVSEIEEKRAGQAINVANIEAGLELARKNFEIMEEELRAAEKTAESRVTIAGMRKEKFIGQSRNLPDGAGEVTSGTNEEMVDQLRTLLDNEMAKDPDAELKYSGLVDNVMDLLGSEENLKLEMGELTNQILLAIDQIRLAQADLRLAKETLDHSKKLAAKFFITQNQLEQDEINYQQRLSRITISWFDLQLLIKYTLPEQLIGLDQEVENAELGLKSVRAANAARRVRERAQLRNSEAQFNLASERLANWDEQIENAVMLAPAPGLVVYAQDGHDWDERVMEGMEVRQRQILIVLPDIVTMVAHFKVHEAQIDKVALNQPAVVRVDAFPERVFTGRVSHVSSLPDSMSRWDNQSLRVYKCTLLLDADNSDGTLRPGMNASVEIGVGVLEDELSVPMTALKRRGDQHYAWKVTPDGPVAVEVELGGNNLTHVVIRSGLAEGDQIYLVQPPGMQLPGPGESGGPSPDENEMGSPVEASGARGRRGG